MINSNSLGDLTNDLHQAGVSETSMDVAARILEGIGGLNPSENLPKAIKDWLEKINSSGGIDGINFIPSDHMGSCHDLLVVVCAGEQDFNLNTMEAIALCIHCQSKIKTVIIVTDYWVEKDFNEWRCPPFDALYDSFGTELFIFTPHAGRWTFNKIIPGRGKKKK